MNVKFKIKKKKSLEVVIESYLSASAQTTRIEKREDVQTNDSWEHAREIDLIDGRNAIDFVACVKQLPRLTYAEHFGNRLTSLRFVPCLEPIHKQLFSLFEKLSF